jgi:hypothetical protein
MLRTNTADLLARHCTCHDKRKPADFHLQASFCSPAVVQTKLARTAAFDQLAADGYFSTNGLYKLGIAAVGQK